MKRIAAFALLLPELPRVKGNTPGGGIDSGGGKPACSSAADGGRAARLLKDAGLDVEISDFQARAACNR
jgi:hypothetical protein